METTGPAKRFFICKTPFLNCWGRFDHKMSAFFRNPENTERAKARCAALAQGNDFIHVYPPFPIYQVEVFFDSAVVFERGKRTILPREAKSWDLLRKEFDLRWVRPNSVATHQTCFDQGIWRRMRQMRVSKLADYLPELRDPWIRTGKGRVALSFMHDGKAYWNAPRFEPELFRAYLAELVR